MPNYTILEVGQRDVLGRVTRVFNTVNGVIGGEVCAFGPDWPDQVHIENPGPPVQLQTGRLQFFSSGFSEGVAVTFDILSTDFAPYAANLRAL